jgi:hypothetical protein
MSIYFCSSRGKSRKPGANQHGMDQWCNSINLLLQMDQWSICIYHLLLLEILRNPGLQINQVIFDKVINFCVTCFHTVFLHNIFKREYISKLLPSSFLIHKPNFPISVFTLLVTTRMSVTFPWVLAFNVLYFSKISLKYADLQTKRSLWNLQHVADSGRFRRWCITHRIAGFLDFPVVRYSREQKTRRFGNWICFRPQMKGGEDTYSGGPLRNS